jgi:pimeloyl-ACP methyl ester carboxylesterase
MPVVRVNGVSIYYEEHGSGEPIIGLHGGGSSAAMWANAAPELALHGRTILYDRRGSFRSERPEPYATNVHEQADDAAALIDALAAAPAIVIGRSYGGAIAVDLALRYSDHVRALVLLEGDVPSVSKTAAKEWADFEERLVAAAEVDPSRAAEALMRDLLGDAAWKRLPEPVKEILLGNGPALIAEARGRRSRRHPRAAGDDRPTDTVRRGRGLNLRLPRDGRCAGLGYALGQSRMGRGRSHHRPRPPGRSQLHRRGARPRVAIRRASLKILVERSLVGRPELEDSYSFPQGKERVVV